MLWYLAHPIAPDDDHTYEDNMADARFWWCFLMRNGVTVCAPWFGLCHALDDSIPEDRTLGMKIDQAVLARCDGIILTGHTLSSGMQREAAAMTARKPDAVINLVGCKEQSYGMEDALTKVLLAEAAPGPCQLDENDLRNAGRSLLEEKYQQGCDAVEKTLWEKTPETPHPDKDTE